MTASWAVTVNVGSIARCRLEVKESRDRVRAALQNAQFEFPSRKISVQ